MNWLERFRARRFYRGMIDRFAARGIDTTWEGPEGKARKQYAEEMRDKYAPGCKLLFSNHWADKQVHAPESGKWFETEGWTLDTTGTAFRKPKYIVFYRPAMLVEGKLFKAVVLHELAHIISTTANHNVEFTSALIPMLVDEAIPTEIAEGILGPVFSRKAASGYGISQGQKRLGVRVAQGP